jgi:hypothetical protein
MGILSRTTIIAALVTGASSLHGFEQRTLYFNVPTAGGLPLTSPPSFPPTPGIGQETEWATYDGDTQLTMGLPGTSAGLLVPNLGSVWNIFSVPAHLQGSLISISLNVQYFTSQVFEFTRTTEDGTFSATTTQTLSLYDFLDPAPAPNPFLVLGGTILERTLNMSGSATLAGPGDTELVPDSDTDVPQTLTFTSGSNFTIAGSTTPGDFTLPATFTTLAGGVTGGNAGIDYTPFGAVLIGVTYTFLPESDWAWAGLPLVFGAWAVRRRMTKTTAC